MAASASNYNGIKTEDIEDTTSVVKITWRPFFRQVPKCFIFFWPIPVSNRAIV